MLIDYQLSQTSVILRVKLRQDSTGSKPGNGFTGVTNASTGLVVAATADNESTATAYTSAGNTIDSITTLGTYAAPTTGHCRLKKVDDTNHPGVVEIQLENSRYAVSNAKSLLVSISGISGMLDCDVCIPLRSVNPYDGVHGGMSALPNTACTTNASLITSGTGTDQLHVVSGVADANTKQWVGGTIPSPNVTGVPLVDSKYLLGTIYSTPATAGIMDVNVKNMNNVAATSITTINANVGTTQPLNFTGTGASAYAQCDVQNWRASQPNTLMTGCVQADVERWAGDNNAITVNTNHYPNIAVHDMGNAALSTTSAQVGVNAVNIGGHAASLDANNLLNVDVAYINAVATSSVTTVNANQGTTSAITFDGNGFQKVDLVDIAGNAVNTSAAQLGVNVVNYGGTAVGSLPPDSVFIRSGTAQGGGASTITLDAGASATNNLYQNCIVQIRSGTGAGQSAIIASYVGSTKVATIVGTWATNPDNTSTFTILPFGSISVTVGNVTVGGYAAGEDPWSIIKAATPSSTPSANTVELLLRLLDADWSVDTSTTPWDIVATINGTGLPASMGGSGTVILRKRVRDTGSSNITNTTTVIGQEIQ